MKAKVDIKFLEVSGRKVDETMGKDKKFIASTSKAISSLCEQIEKYFKSFNIKVKVNFEIK
jgi:hypothetical protein